MLYLAIELIILSIAFLAFHIRVTLGLILTPYIFIRHPMDNPFSIIGISFRLMRGNKIQALKLLLSYIVYLPLMALIVTIPLIIPNIMMSVTVFAESTASEYAVKQVKMKKLNQGEIKLKILRFKVECSEPITIKDFLSRNGVSRRLMTKLKRQTDGITCNGEKIRTIDMVKNGDEVVTMQDESF